MITLTTLRDAFQAIFFGDDASKTKYIVPLQGNWFIPTRDPAETIATWIGYTILEHRPLTRTALYSGVSLERQLRTAFRLTFTGPQAEEIANSTLFWEYRSDVKEAFEKMTAQLAYEERRIYTRVMPQEGFNDTLVWVTDMVAMSTVEVTPDWKPWIPLY